MRVQQQVCVLKSCEEGEEVQTARQILKEARDSRAVSRLPLNFVCVCVSVCCVQAFYSCQFFISLHISSSGGKRWTQAAALAQTDYMTSCEKT